MLIWHLIQHLWWPMNGQLYALGSSWVGTNIGIFTVWYTVWRRHNCHHRWCPRIARSVVDKAGHHQLYCHRHVNEHIERQEA